MKITVVLGSPHKKGSSNLLAQNFIQGAQEAGHEVVIFDAGHSDIHPCTACNACRMNGACIHKDAIVGFQEVLMYSDMIVFVTPLHYFGFSAQMKTVIDRFYNINTKLSSKALKSALIVAAWDNVAWTLKDIKEHYLTICRYLHFKNVGMIIAGGCGTPEKTAASEYPNKAYELGKSI